jgi:mannosyl-3-phosphoglycerate phosphatase family protein
VSELAGPAGAQSLRLVFTDLDGSLLDHHTYSYRDALPQIHMLEHLGIPLIPTSSKTRVEIEQLRVQLGNEHPFISENGAAVFIPLGYFDTQPEQTVEREGYWVHEASRGREDWLALLAALRRSFAGEFEHFFYAGTDGIVGMTNLPEAQAMLANQRDYSEPVLWLGSARRRQEFIEALHGSGASVLQGGRFLTVSGDCDKGRALSWLRETYRRAARGSACRDIAIGDSGNDCAMLETATTALLVRSPAHEFPA